jgi:hypothetical protein
MDKLRQEVDSAVNAFRTGMKVERDRVLEPLIFAYDMALQDPATKIPTYLHAALERARREAGK